MSEKTNSFVSRALVSAMFAIALVAICVAVVPVWRAAAQKPEPWSDAQTVKPADFAKELANAKGADKPVIVCAGFRVLFESAHIPGAVFHGPASSQAGVDDLKKWAHGIPKSANLVVYCGCCPLAQCPNIRPAFETLRSMGFTHLRVLLIPEDFAKNWIDNGYPVEKGK